LKSFIASAAFAAGTLIAAGSAFADEATGKVAQIHDGNVKFCVRLGNTWYFVPGHQQQDFRDALVGNLTIAFTFDPAMKVTCHANGPTGGVDAGTVTADVDLLPPQ
jgi:hypothetical protein